MTTREIAEIAGVSVQTVRRTAETYIGYVFEAGKKAVFSEKESIEIMRELKKKGFIQPVQNGQTPIQNGQAPLQNAEVVTKSDLAAFGTAIVSEVIKQLMPMILSVGGHPATLSIESKQAPKLSPRDELRMIVNKAADETKEYGATYKKLYTEIYYRLHINVTERAKNAKTTAIDILEAEGLLENAVLIAKEIF